MSKRAGQTVKPKAESVVVFLDGGKVDVKEIGTSEACGEGMQDVVLRPGVFLRFRAAGKNDTDALSQWLIGEGREVLRAARDHLIAQGRADQAADAMRTWLLLHLARNCLVGISAGFERDDAFKGFASAMSLPHSTPLAEILAALFSLLPGAAADVEKAIGVPLAPILEGVEKRRAMH